MTRAEGMTGAPIPLFTPGESIAGALLALATLSAVGAVALPAGGLLVAGVLAGLGWTLLVELAVVVLEVRERS